MRKKEEKKQKEKHMVHKIKESGAFLYMIRFSQSGWRWGGGILKKVKVKIVTANV